MDQLDIFDMLYETYKVDKPIRLIEFFAGIGSQAKALERMGVDFQHWKICEWAIPSILAYKEIHSKYLPNDADHSKDLTKDELVEYLFNKGISSNYNEPMKLEQVKRLGENKLRQIYNSIITENNLVNIQQTKGSDLNITDTDKYTYMLTYSFPCQDLSLAGKGAGMSRDGGTRSGMLWEVERILDECNELGGLPHILLMENVPQVIGEKNIKDFQSWRAKLESLGYSNYVEVLNAKDYGIPQNRQRCFMISILGDYSYTFPRTIPLGLKLKDMLEDNVDEKYYLSDKMINYISANNEKWTGNNGESLVNKTIASTINTGEGSKRCDASNYIGDDLPDNYNIKQLHKTLRETLETNDIESIEDAAYIDAYNRNIRSDNITGSITTRVDASNNSYVAIRKYGIFDKDGKRHQAGSVYDENGLSPTLDTMHGGWRQPCIEIKEATKKGYKEAYEGDGIDISSRMASHRGTLQKGIAQTIKTSVDVGVVVKDEYVGTYNFSASDNFMGDRNRFQKDREISPTLLTAPKEAIVLKTNEPRVLGGIGEKKSNGGTQWYQQDRIYDDNVAISVTTVCNPYYKSNLRIRKLTPKECYRLMGFDDEDCDNASKVISDSMIYHTAGDSIVVDVLMAIFKELML